MACEGKSVEEAPDFPSAKELFSAANYLQVKPKSQRLYVNFTFDSIRRCQDEVSQPLLGLIYLHSQGVAVLSRRP
jgi:hypothetical protein